MPTIHRSPWPTGAKHAIAASNAKTYRAQLERSTWSLLDDELAIASARVESLRKRLKREHDTHKARRLWTALASAAEILSTLHARRRDSRT